MCSLVGRMVVATLITPFPRWLLLPTVPTVGTRGCDAVAPDPGAVTLRSVARGFEGGFDQRHRLSA